MPLEKVDAWVMGHLVEQILVPVHVATLVTAGIAKANRDAWTEHERWAGKGRAS